MTDRDLRVYWAFLCAAALSLVTAVVLFQPWLVAAGRRGKVVANAFGRTQGTTDPNLADVWGEGANPAHISGAWGVLTAAAALATIVAVGLYLRDGRVGLALLVLGCATGQALSVLCTLLYLNSKGQVFKTLVESPGTGALGGLLSDERTVNVREAADVSFGSAAIFGGVTALGTVVIVVICILPIRGTTTDVPAEPGPNAPA
ncbi:hypothetical protein [Nocardia blacklockiae]|uniref:hypothetical protein n=1 Tax=Nocardia blacklockiae TaxID=480036 RepID=UPI001893A0CD|nr:hypothetical protein [Nocardia blacklockiae]MBF6175169.1 hypothetical protein [Nocardia blacklockiae]